MNIQFKATVIECVDGKLISSVSFQLKEKSGKSRKEINRIFKEADKEHEKLFGFSTGTIRGCGVVGCVDESKIEFAKSIAGCSDENSAEKQGFSFEDFIHG